MNYTEIKQIFRALKCDFPRDMRKREITPQKQSENGKGHNGGVS